MTDLNPQVKQMSDESMVRNLEAQANAIWPQESEFVIRYGLHDDIRILDAGCGTGEGAVRFAGLFPKAQVLGVDILDHHLALARERHAHIGPRLTFEHRSVYELGLPDATFDLTVCRHVIHSIPFADRVLAELVRVTKPGGRVHVIPEDYDMLHFPTRVPGLREFWQVGPARMSEKTGTDMFVGRHTAPMLAALGLEDVRMDYVILDTLRVPRETFARIIEAWRDGYVEIVAEMTGFAQEQTRGWFEATIAAIRDPNAYSVWMVPVASGRVPFPKPRA